MKQKVEISKCFQFGNIESLDSFLNDITHSKKDNKELSSYSGHNLYAFRDEEGYLVTQSGNPLDSKFRSFLNTILSSALSQYALSDIKVDILYVYNLDDESDYNDCEDYNILKSLSDNFVIVCEPMALSKKECTDAFNTVIDSCNNGKVKGRILALALLNDFSDRSYTKIFRIFANKQVS